MEMQEHNAKIKSVTLGKEDHGIPTSWLMCDWGGNSQGFGGFDLRGDAMVKWVIGIQEALNVPDWSRVEGSICRIRRYEGSIVAIGNIIEDRWFHREEMMSDD